MPGEKKRGVEWPIKPSSQEIQISSYCFILGGQTFNAKGKDGLRSKYDSPALTTVLVNMADPESLLWCSRFDSKALTMQSHFDRQPQSHTCSELLRIICNYVFQNEVAIFTDP